MGNFLQDAHFHTAPVKKENSATATPIKSGSISTSNEQRNPTESGSVVHLMCLNNGCFFHPLVMVKREVHCQTSCLSCLPQQTPHRPGPLAARHPLVFQVPCPTSTSLSSAAWRPLSRHCHLCRMHTKKKTTRGGIKHCQTDHQHNSPSGGVCH